MAEPLAPDTYPVTIWNIYVTSSKSSLFSIQLVLSNRDAGVFVCSIAADWPTAVPWTLFQALSSPQPSALCPWPLVLASVHRDRLTACSFSIFLSLSPSPLFVSRAVSSLCLFLTTDLPDSLNCSDAIAHWYMRLVASRPHFVTWLLPSTITNHWFVQSQYTNPYTWYWWGYRRKVVRLAGTYLLKALNERTVTLKCLWTVEAM